VLYTWTAYTATIGFGWTHAVDTLGNTSATPPFYLLAARNVGGWLEALMIIAISTSSLACALAFHNAMVRYLYAMGREGVLSKIFGRTHPKFHSPNIAIITQSLFTIVLIVFFAFIVQKINHDNSISYAFGIGDGKVWTQIDGIDPYNWLAEIGTIALIVVYVLVNIGSPLYALRSDRKSFNIFTHIVAPVLSSLVLLVPLVAFVMPTVPGPIGSFFTNLGFAVTPFPMNILPIFVVLWVIVGIVYASYLKRTAPKHYEELGLMVRTDV
jgi:amino acid transporter